MENCPILIFMKTKDKIYASVVIAQQEQPVLLIQVNEWARISSVEIQC